MDKVLNEIKADMNAPQNNEVVDESESKKNLSKRTGKGFALKPVQFISLGFVLLILIGSFLLSLPISHENGNWFNYVNSLFTATSAVCVTGLSVVDTATTFSLFGEIVIIVLIQAGGLGFMTLASFLFFIIGKKITLKERLAMQEAYNSDNLQGLIKITRMIVITTFTIELIGASFLAFSFIPKFGAGRGIYYSVFHAISAFCNAGFDLMGVIAPGAGLSPFQTDVIANIGIMSMIVFGSLGFTVISDIIKKHRFSKFVFHTKVVLVITGILFLFGTVFFTVSEWSNPNTIGGLNPFQKFMFGAFQAISPRTAGFSTVDQANLNVSSKIMTMIYMFIGASPASTGGGVKNTTFIILLALFFSGARGEQEIKLRGRSIHKQVGYKAVAILMFGLFVVFLSTLMLCVIEIDILGNDVASFESILFECISAFATVGFTLGLTTHLGVASKLILCVVMLVGRLGTLSLGLLTFSKKDVLNIKYPDAKIIIG